MSITKIPTIHSKHSAGFIADNYFASIQKHRSTLHFLCVLTLKKYMAKLQAIHLTLPEKKTKKVPMTAEEALAFHLAYRNGYLDTECPFVKEVFTVIDRKISK